jgi:hypothetical protein
MATEKREAEYVHRCSCGVTFESAEELRRHAREEHDAVV